MFARYGHVCPFSEYSTVGHRRIVTCNMVYGDSLVFTCSEI